MQLSSTMKVDCSMIENQGIVKLVKRYGRPVLHDLVPVTELTFIQSPGVQSNKKVTSLVSQIQAP